MNPSLKIALGIVCAVIGAACLIGAICMVPFISASEAIIPAMFGAVGALFLWFAYCYDRCAGTTISLLILDNAEPVRFLLAILVPGALFRFPRAEPGKENGPQQALRAKGHKLDFHNSST
jgi:hypothetical protein